MSADEYQAAFHGIELPRQTELFPGTVVSDVNLFIASELEILRMNQSVRIRDAITYRLDRLLEIIHQQ